jgi:DNA-binding NarL/FixJ family response regulator
MIDGAIRILIADDQSHSRSALRLLLKFEPGMRVVGEADDVGRALELAAATRPDVVLMDWELPDQDSAATLVGLRQAWPGAAVIALSGRPEARQEALLAQADGFVSKWDPPERLLAAVRGWRRREFGQLDDRVGAQQV